MNDKIMAVRWLTGNMGSFGVVAVRREDGWKAYLGTAKGYSEDSDAAHIAAHGAPLMEGEGRGFFPRIDEPYDY